MLTRKAEFEKILSDYKISEHGKGILSRTELVILCGPFASGRNAIISALVKNGGYRFIVSDTTRPPKVRDGVLEQDGVQYYFRSEDQIIADLKKGEFLEAELIHGQQVSGISIRELERAAQSNEIAINEVDLGGVLKITEAKPDTHVFFILPPGYQEWQRRIRGREDMSETEFANRLKTARRNIQEALNNPVFTLIVNESLSQAANTIDALVTGKAIEYDAQSARQVALKLLESLDSQPVSS